MTYPTAGANADRLPLSESTAPPLRVLDRLAVGRTVPTLPAGRWLDALYAPQAHPNARRDYAQRAATILSLLDEPGLDELARWAWGCWPGDLPALAGVLAAAPSLQAVARRDRAVEGGWAGETIAAAVGGARELPMRRQRAGADRYRHPGVVFGVALERIPEVTDEPPVPEAAERAEEVVAWVAGHALPTPGRAGKALLVVEANLPAFWAWYARRAPLGDVADGRFPAPPLTRDLGGGQRLDDHLAGGTDNTGMQRRLTMVSRLLLGPRRHRGHPAGQGWRSGIGYWSLVALDAWSKDHRPPSPPGPTVSWWAQQLSVIATQPAPWEPPAAFTARNDIVA